MMRKWFMDSVILMHFELLELKMFSNVSNRENIWIEFNL